MQIDEGKDEDKGLSMNIEELRLQAEKRLLTRKTGSIPRTREEMLRFVHEIEVHQIELEMQNEELLRARYDLEQALEKYTDLYDFAPVGYCTLDHNGIISEINFAGAVLLGGERSRLVGRPFTFHVLAESRQAFTAFLDNTFEIEEKCSLEALLTNNEQSFWVQIIALSCEYGRKCRFALIDISERRRAEDALAEKGGELEELNRTLEGRIERAVKELHQKDQMLVLQDRQAVMGEMIHNIAHQWRQPLNTLGLVIQQLPLAYDTGELSKQFLEESVAMSMKVIQQMSRTIEDFRGFFSSSKTAVAFRVNQVIAQTLSFIEKTLKDHKIGFAVYTEGEPVANGYPNEYAQVLLNILMNARDALVALKVDDALISIRAVMEGGKSVVTITDNAGGIPEEIIDKIFDPYFSTKGPDKGTGIGLFMSRTIIEKNMGGSLTVLNTGNGAEFRIEI